MGENNKKELNYEELAFLRKNTILGPVALLKIERAKLEVERFRKWYKSLEGELLSSDYSLVDELEYELRFKAWETSCGPLWRANKDGLELIEFSKLVMEQQIEMSKKNKNNKKR